jgi:hypothetical protein
VSEASSPFKSTHTPRSMHLQAKTGAIARVITLTCIALVVFIGLLQAVHSHSEKDQLANHDCSICSVVHLGILHKSIPTQLPIFVQTGSVVIASVSTKSSSTVLAFCIRPPPSV